MNMGPFGLADLEMKSSPNTRWKAAVTSNSVGGGSLGAGVVEAARDGWGVAMGIGFSTFVLEADLPLQASNTRKTPAKQRAGMIEKGNELGDRPFEIDVVFPQSVIGIDEQCLGAIRSPHLFMITAPSGNRRFDRLVPYEERSNRELEH